MCDVKNCSPRMEVCPLVRTMAAGALDVCDGSLRGPHMTSASAVRLETVLTEMRSNVYPRERES